MIPINVLISLHIYRGESAGAVGVQRLEGQFLCQLPLQGLLLTSVEAAGVAVSGEVQLSVSAEAGADERRRCVRDQRGDVDGRVVRRLQEGQADGEEEQEEQEQVWRHLGDGKTLQTTEN